MVADTGLGAGRRGARFADLALVIPVRNDPEGLAALLAQATALGIFDQIVVVDDGSDPPVVLPRPASDLGSRPVFRLGSRPKGPVPELIRHAVSRGGGVARNRGLEAVRTGHVLFFDADDLLTDEVVSLVADLRRWGRQRRRLRRWRLLHPPFDVCLFKHADERIAAAHLWGQPGWDEMFWSAAGCATAALDRAPARVLPLLAQTANYPWNKIYRTRFLRDHGIGCAETAVHQDIPLHWLGFLAATEVLVSARVCAFHRVRRGGTRVTNRRGRERLEVFDALRPVRDAVMALPVTFPESGARTATGPATGPGAAAQADGGLPWRQGFVAFTLGLVDWIAERIVPHHLDDLRAAERRFLAPMIQADWAAALDGTDAALAARLRARAGVPGPVGGPETLSETGGPDV